MFEEEKARIWTSNVGTPLYVDDEIAGYLCTQAQEGDLLLQIENGNGLPIWLVIRPSDSHNQEPRFSIIGPALANPGFAVQSTERTGYTDMYDHSRIPEDQRNMPSVFDLWFDQEEFLVWRAWVYSFEKGVLSKEEVDEFVRGRGVVLRKSWAVLKEKGVDWGLP